MKPKTKKQVTYGWINKRRAEYEEPIDPREHFWLTRGCKIDWMPEAWPPVLCRITIEYPVAKPKKEKKP